MQASRPLFQAAIKLKGQPAAIDIVKVRPFLSVWSAQDHISYSPSPLHQQRRTMASATSFFDFTPKDSKSSFGRSQHNLQSLTSSTNADPSSLNRERRTLPTLPTRGQSDPRRQHRLEMRLHTAIQGPRESLQEDLGKVP
jgi:hypothetical protein